MRLNIVPSRHSVRLENGMYETRMKDSIIINYTPKGEFDLINKGLADHYIDRIDLNRLETIFSKNLFPNYKGHFDKINNEWYFNHTTKGKSNDAYMTVDKRGFITKSQRKMPPNTIDKLGFEKIDRNSFPKIVEGLGIKNAVNLTGTGVVKGGLIYKDMSERPDAPLTTAKTRKFLNSKEMYEIGDIIMVRADVDMSNTSFLKLDGRQYKVDQYKELYEKLGPFYGLDLSKNHYGQPWKDPRRIVWSDKTTEIEPTMKSIFIEELSNLGGHCSFITKDFLYVCGGYKGDRRKPLKSVYKCELLDNGLIGKITRLPDLPEPRVFSRALTFCGHVYILGGSKNPTKYNGGERIIKAKIKEDGTLGEWFFGEKLPEEFIRSFFYLSGNRLYIISGVKVKRSYTQNGNYITEEEQSNKRFWCFINPDGTLKTPWKEETILSSESWDAQFTPQYSSCSYSAIYNNTLRMCGLLSVVNFKSKFQTPDVHRWGLNNLLSFTGTATPSSGMTRNYIISSNSGNSADCWVYVTGHSSTTSGVSMLYSRQYTEDPYPKVYADSVATNGRTLIIGGLDTKNPSVNTTSTKNKGLISMSYKSIFPVDKNNTLHNLLKYQFIENNPETFNLPLVEDMAFNGEVYSYYIKAR